MVLPNVERPVILSVATWSPLKRVDVALATKLPTFWMERREPGDDVAMPRKPLGLMVSAGIVEVARAVEVAM